MVDSNIAREHAPPPEQKEAKSKPKRCSTCGILGHNKRSCEQPTKEHKGSVCANVKRMLDNMSLSHSRPVKIKQATILLDYLAFHRWFVLSHHNFQKIVLNKLKEFETQNFPNTEYYRKIFTKPKVKKIKTNECPICYEKLQDINVCTTKCGHSFCHQCMMKSLKWNNKCPSCRDKLS